MRTRAWFPNAVLFRLCRWQDGWPLKKSSSFFSFCKYDAEFTFQYFLKCQSPRWPLANRVGNSNSLRMCDYTGRKYELLLSTSSQIEAKFYPRSRSRQLWNCIWRSRVHSQVKQSLTDVQVQFRSAAHVVSPGRSSVPNDLIWNFLHSTDIIRIYNNELSAASLWCRPQQRSQSSIRMSSPKPEAAEETGLGEATDRWALLRCLLMNVFVVYQRRHETRTRAGPDPEADPGPATHHPPRANLFWRHNIICSFRNSVCV